MMAVQQILPHPAQSPDMNPIELGHIEKKGQYKWEISENAEELRRVLLDETKLNYGK